jgi:hypothetical protein
VPILLDGSDFLSVALYGFLNRGRFAIFHHWASLNSLDDEGL